MCFENIPCKALHSGKMGFGTAPRRCGIHSKPRTLLQKTCLFYVFETLAKYARVCLRTHAVAHIHKLLPTYVGRGPLWSFYFQKYIIVYIKGYIFYFSTPQVNLIFDWVLNWP